MMGANEALRYLNYRLDLSDSQTADSDKDYATMTARNPYLSFRSLSAFLRSEKQFGFVASTFFWPYADVNNPKFFNDDSLGFAGYMAKHKPQELAEIQGQSASILNLAERKIKPFKDEAKNIAYHWYSKTYEKRLKLKNDSESLLSSEFQKDLESLEQKLSQKIQLSDKAFIEISAKSGGLSCSPLYGNEREYIPNVYIPHWTVMSKLSVSMPCKIDENHVLVNGISNNLASVELSVPEINPSIIVNIERNEMRDPFYQFKLKESGIEEQDIERMIKLLLI